MDEEMKDIVDVVAGTTAIATVAAWLPPTASLQDKSLQHQIFLQPALITPVYVILL